MTALELAVQYFPTATPEQCRDVLWGCTGFPGFFAPKEGQTCEDVLREQLASMAERSGADPILAQAIAGQEMDETMNRFHDAEAELSR